MADVFISYSRKNNDFARRLIDKLILRGKDAWVDWEGIPLTSPNWWSDIKSGIEAADSFVFIMSPDSMASIVCNMELDYAIELRKRIVPVVYLDVTARDAFASVADFEPDEAMQERLAGKDALIMARDNWQRLSHINWVFFRKSDDFDSSFDRLISTVETDLSYVRAHTRYLTRAQEWQRENQREDLLLFGEEINLAEEWLKQAERYAANTPDKNTRVDVVNPLPRDLHRTYIHMSRTAATKREQRLTELQNAAVRAEQASLESHQQAQTAEKSRKRARQTLVMVAITSALLIIIAFVLTGSQINDAQAKVNTSGTQVADAQSVLTDVPPTLTQVNQQVVSAQNQANQAETQVANANDALTAVPPTLTQVNQQVVTAQGRADQASTQVADANGALTAVPPTLTLVNEQVIAAQGQADTASTRVADANSALTAVPPTLNAVATNVAAAENRIEALRLASLANDELQNGNAITASLLGIRSLDVAYTSQADATTFAAVRENHVRLALVGHAGGLNSAAYSPDGRFIVTASWDKTSIIWNADTGEQVRSLNGHTGYVNSASYSPDGHFIVTASSDKTAIVWNARTGEKIRTLTISVNEMLYANYSPDGRFIVTNGDDHTAIVWDANTGEKLHTLAGHTNVVVYAAYSPDGHYIATASWDNTAIIWNANTGQVVHKLAYHRNAVNSVAFSPNGNFVVTTSDDNTSIIWDAISGEPIHILEGYTDGVMSAAYSSDGQYIATSSRNGTVVIWDAVTGRRVRTLVGHNSGVYSVAYSPDDHYIITASYDRTALVWDLSTTQPIRTIVDVKTAAYSPDGHNILAMDINDHPTIFDAVTGKKLHTFTDNNQILSAIYSPDGNYIVTTGYKTVLIWDAHTYELQKTLTLSALDVEHVVFSPDYHYLAAASRDNSVYIWDMSKSQIVQTLHYISPYEGHFGNVSYSPDGKYMVGGGLDGAVVWDVATGKIVYALNEQTDWIYNPVYSPDGRYILTASRDKTIVLWDANTGQRIRTFATTSDAVNSAVYSPDGRYILTADGSSLEKEKRAIIWDVATGEQIRTLEGHTAAVTSASYSPEGRYIITASADNTAIIWDADYHDFISFACTHIARDFTDDERARFGILDNGPTCPQFKTSGSS